MDTLATLRFLDAALHPDSPFFDMKMALDKAPPTADPAAKDLLLLAMQHYGAAKTLQIKVNMETSEEATQMMVGPLIDHLHRTSDGMNRTEMSTMMHKRMAEHGLSIDLAYEAPNRFSVRMNRGSRFNSHVVCDGYRYLEHTNVPKLIPNSGHSPRTIAESPFATNLLLGGSPLWSLLTGTAGFGRLADDSLRPIGFYGQNLDVNGVKAHMVGFYSPSHWGQVRMLIGERTGLVHWLTYDQAPTRLTATTDRHKSFVEDMPGPLRNLAGEILRAMLPPAMTTAVDITHNSANKAAHAGSHTIDPIYGPVMQRRFRVELVDVNHPIDPTLYLVP